MDRELPDIPLSLNAFSRRLKVSPQRIVRAVTDITPPLQMEGKKIAPSEYPRIVELMETIHLLPGESFEIAKRLNADPQD